VRALKASLRPQATARRDGVWQTLDAAALVPGDLVLLASGSHVPADCKARAARARACRHGLPQLVARATEQMSREPLPRRPYHATCAWRQRACAQHNGTGWKMHTQTGWAGA